MAIKNIVNKGIRTPINDSRISDANIQAVHTLVSVIPLEAVPENLSAQNPVVDELYVQNRFSWTQIDSN